MERGASVQVRLYLTFVVAHACSIIPSIKTHAFYISTLSVLQLFPALSVLFSVRSIQCFCYMLLFLSIEVGGILFH